MESQRMESQESQLTPAKGAVPEESQLTPAKGAVPEESQLTQEKGAVPEVPPDTPDEEDMSEDITHTFTIESAAWVSGCSFRLVEQDGKSFFNLKKADRKIARLIFGTKRVEDIRRTDIIEKITKLRDERFKELLALPPTAKVWQKRLTHKKVIGKATSLPDVITICAPSVSNIEATDMNVICSKGGVPLWIEMNEDNLTYISKAMHAQVESGDIVCKHPRDNHTDQSRVSCPAPGICFAHDRNSWRVTTPIDNSTKAKRTRYFKCEKYGGNQEALEMAMQCQWSNCEV